MESSMNFKFKYFSFGFTLEWIKLHLYFLLNISFNSGVFIIFNNLFLTSRDVKKMKTSCEPDVNINLIKLELILSDGPWRAFNQSLAANSR